MVPIPRRSVLVSLGTASFSIAGCLGPSDPSTSPTTESATQPSETSAEGPTDITLTNPEVRKNARRRSRQLGGPPSLVRAVHHRRVGLVSIGAAIDINDVFGFTVPTSSGIDRAVRPRNPVLGSHRGDCHRSVQVQVEFRTDGLPLGDGDRSVTTRPFAFRNAVENADRRSETGRRRTMDGTGATEGSGLWKRVGVGLRVAPPVDPGVDEWS